MDYMDAMPPCPHCGKERWAGSAHVCEPKVFNNLHSANKARQVLWNKGTGTNGPLYAATELAGEVGEVCNVVKKLEREKRGLVGSRSTVADLEDELGDVLICVNLLALEYGIDPERAAARKFNKTSRKLGFPVLMDEGPANA